MRTYRAVKGGCSVGIVIAASCTHTQEMAETVEARTTAKSIQEYRHVSE